MTVAEDAFMDLDGYMLEPIGEQCRPHQLLGALQTCFFPCRFESQLQNVDVPRYVISTMPELRPRSNACHVLSCCKEIETVSTSLNELGADLCQFSSRQHASAVSKHSKHNCLMVQLAPGSSNLVISAPAMFRTVCRSPFYSGVPLEASSSLGLSHPPGTGLIRHQWRGAQMCLDVGRTGRRVSIVLHTSGTWWAHGTCSHRGLCQPCGSDWWCPG